MIIFSYIQVCYDLWGLYHCDPSFTICISQLLLHSISSIWLVSPQSTGRCCMKWIFLHTLAFSYQHTYIQPMTFIYMKYTQKYLYVCIFFSEMFVHTRVYEWICSKIYAVVDSVFLFCICEMQLHKCMCVCMAELTNNTRE